MGLVSCCVRFVSRNFAAPPVIHDAAVSNTRYASLMDELVYTAVRHIGFWLWACGWQCEDVRCRVVPRVGVDAVSGEALADTQHAVRR